METIITLTTLYFIFQVGLFTFTRLMTKGEEHEFSLKQYKISLIPLFGVLYVIFLIFKKALTK